MLMRAAMLAAALFAAGTASATAAEVCTVERPADGDIKAFAARYFPGAGAREIEALIACLGDPDPAVRDDFAFTLWYHGFNGKLLPVPMRRHAVERLSAILAGPDDAGGFLRPFAALALFPAARADRADPYLSDAERHALAETAATYMRGITDYRGFTPGEGWRHAVAHASDIMVELAQNPRLTRADALAMLGAIAAQVAPEASPYYHQGESVRIARPVLLLAARADIDDAAWTAWFRTLHPDDGAQWRAPYASDLKLAAVHNSRAFASAVYVGAAEAGDPRVRRLVPLAADLLKALR